MTSPLPSKSGSHPSRSRSVFSRTYDEFHVATFWIYHEAAILHILNKAKAFHIPGCDITFQVKEKWFKVVCLKQDTVKIQDRFARLLSDLDQGDQWDQLINQDQRQTHPWIHGLRSFSNENEVILHEGVSHAKWDSELAHRLEVPSEFQQYKFVRIFKDIDDLEPEGITAEDVISHEIMAKLEQISTVRIAAPGIGRVVYVGGRIRSDVDAAMVRLSNLQKRSRAPKLPIRHSFYTELSARDTPVEARLCNDINPVLVSGCILDPMHGVEATIEEYKLLKQTVSIRAIQKGPNGMQRSYFGPRSKGLFRLQEARRYIHQFVNWSYQPKRPDNIDGAVSVMDVTGFYLGEKSTVMGWIQSITSDPPVANIPIDSDFSISNEVAAPLSMKLQQPVSSVPIVLPAYVPQAVKSGLLSQPRACKNDKYPVSAGKQIMAKARASSGQTKNTGSSTPKHTGFFPQPLQDPCKSPWSSSAITTSKKPNGSALQDYRARLGMHASSQETWPPPSPPPIDSRTDYPTLGTSAATRLSHRPPAYGPSKCAWQPQRCIGNETDNLMPVTTSGSRSLLVDEVLAAPGSDSGGLVATPFKAESTNTSMAPHPFAFDMEPLTPVQRANIVLPSISAYDDRATHTFHETMRQLAPSRSIQSRFYQEPKLLQPPVTMDPDVVFMDDLKNKVGDLLEHLRFRMGKVELRVVFGRIHLKSFTREGIATNTKFEEHFGWRPDVFLERMHKAYTTWDNILFANIFSIYGQDAEALHRVTSLCASRPQVGNAVPWEQDSTCVVYEFTCHIGTDKLFVIDVDAESFEFKIRDLSGQVAPVLIHCLHRHWDLAITATCSPVEGVKQIYHSFAQSLVKSLEIIPKTTGKLRLWYSEAFHNSSNSPIVTALRVLHIVSFCSPARKTTLHITQVQVMSTILLPERDGGWKRYKATPAEELPEKGIFSTWFKASLSSPNADKILESNEYLKLGDESEWTAKALLDDGCVEPLLKPALAMVKEMDGIGVLCNNRHGVSAEEVISLLNSLAEVEFW